MYQDKCKRLLPVLRRRISLSKLTWLWVRVTSVLLSLPWPPGRSQLNSALSVATDISAVSPLRLSWVVGELNCHLPYCKQPQIIWGKWWCTNHKNAGQFESIITFYCAYTHIVCFSFLSQKVRLGKNFYYGVNESSGKGHYPPKWLNDAKNTSF